MLIKELYKLEMNLEQPLIFSPQIYAYSTLREFLPPRQRPGVPQAYYRLQELLFLKVAIKIFSYYFK